MQTIQLTFNEHSEAKPNMYKIKATGADGTHTYTGFQGYQGTENMDWAYIKGLKQGDIFAVSYEIYNGEFNGKPYQSRNIKSAGKAGSNEEVPVEYQTPSQEIGARTSAPPKPLDIAKGRDFEAEAFGKCKHAYLLIAFEKSFEKPVETGQMEKMAEEWATMSCRKLPKSNADTMREGFVSKDSSLQPDEEMPVGNIDFNN